MSERSEGFERCPGNLPFCLGMVEFNCSGMRPMEGSTSQSDDVVSPTAKRQKLPLHFKKKVLSPSSRFNIIVSDAEIEKSPKG